MKTLEELNTIVIGINKDSIKSHKNFIQKQDLNYLLLSDEEKIACEAFNVLKEKNMFGKKSIGIERSTFIINEEGIIIKEYRKVKIDGHVSQVIDFIKSNKK